MHDLMCWQRFGEAAGPATRTWRYACWQRTSRRCKWTTPNSLAWTLFSALHKAIHAQWEPLR